MVGPRAGTAIGASPAGACSPGEIAHALENGFASTEVSFTGTNVSERDLDVIGPAGVHVNLDLLSQVDRWTALPGARRRPAAQPARRRHARLRGEPEKLLELGCPLVEVTPAEGSARRCSRVRRLWTSTRTRRSSRRGSAHSEELPRAGELCFTDRV